MFEIKLGDKGQVVMAGRFDASQADRAEAVFDGLAGPTVVDFERLDYISSMGLGILLKAQKRLSESGAGLTLVNVSKHIHEILRFSGFHQVFDIRVAGD